jgi:hypothetical protein
MPNDRRQFLEEVIRRCDEQHREQLEQRLEQTENTGGRGVMVAVLKAGGTAVFFAKLAFQEESGAWRYGLFDPARHEMRGETDESVNEPLLVSKRSWHRLNQIPRGPGVDRRGYVAR